MAIERLPLLRQMGFWAQCSGKAEAGDGGGGTWPLKNC